MGHAESKRSNIPIEGWVDPKFQQVKDAFRNNFVIGNERQGAAFAVYRKGELVVDLWGGYADGNSGRLWKEDTMTVAFSSTKAVAALCAAYMVDKGYLDYDALVTQYWSEFGKFGKEDTTVSMLVNHQAGLAAIDQKITMEDMEDWESLGKKFEQQKPNWTPGEEFGYHALSYGWLVDQLIRRTDPKQRSLGQLFRDAIGTPNDVDFFIGLPLEQYHRVARHTPPPFSLSDFSNLRTAKMAYKVYKANKDSMLIKTVTNPDFLYDKSLKGMRTNDPDLLKIEIGAGTGVGTARGLAQIFSLVSEGKILLNQPVFAKLASPSHENEYDKVLDQTLNRGWGYMYSRSPTGSWAFGHPGYGGQNVKVDLENGLAMAYLTNGLTSDMGDEAKNWSSLCHTVYQSL